jgi:hypothetical protein
VEEAGPSEPNPAPPVLPPEVRNEVFDKINTRLLFAAGKKTGWQPPIGKIETLITLKGQVISRMAELDPHPFWVEEQSRNRLIAESI